ncbi:putative neuronal-specific septin-3 isoform X3 [Apostichopus japonicus]|uniref:Putative neuronal-specific septin-3 isoform X3 n=1 Tax=Stichopus japonicus TaxID=307972 RepID=A0A2G8LHD9_STIJA|nr:putative neuronal-specific septin-3 isoform X3 [Apostichopus japonicus]
MSFIPLFVHSLKPLDIEVMKRLDKVCNVMPVISKADTLTIEERATFKNSWNKEIKEELKKHGVQTYPMKGVNEDADDAKINDVVKDPLSSYFILVSHLSQDQIPFAVVGSDKTHEIDGKKVLGRLTNWGLIEVENPKHCEFSHLRNMLIRTHMQDLKEVTDSIHYENFRRERLAANKSSESRGESLLTNISTFYCKQLFSAF